MERTQRNNFKPMYGGRTMSIILYNEYLRWYLRSNTEPTELILKMIKTFNGIERAMWSLKRKYYD